MVYSVAPDVKKDLLYQMLRIRLIEEAIAERYPEQKMRTPTHLSIGQEAVPAAISQCLNKTDYAVSTHRGHAHYFGKGGDLNAMIAELHGKVTGCCRGRGGSMHLIDESVGFMGSTAIVGNTIPIGLGLGLSAKLDAKGQVSCIFLGDGAIEEGVFFESLNIAVVQKLPVLFICENNRFSVYSPFHKRQPRERNIYDVAAAVGANIDYGDGNNVLECRQKIQQAVDAMREGSGPYFLEFETYRWREHCGPNYDNDLGYRSEDEFLEWKARDPVAQFARQLITEGLMTDDDYQSMHAAICNEIDDAFDFAEQSPFPPAIEATTGVYKEDEKQGSLNEQTDYVCESY